MTLIAAAKIEDTPALIGDFMISSSVKSNAGEKKKIVKLSDNCVIGWCGSDLAAQIVFVKLFHRFKDPVRISKQQVEDFFVKEASPDQKTKLHANFIGWITEAEQAYCFRWRTDYPEMVFYENRHFEGSGAVIAQLYFDNIAKQPKSSDPRAAERGIVDVLGHLMSCESRATARNLKTWGVAYEALYYDGVTFKYIGPISYIYLDVTVDETLGRFTTSIGGELVKYRAHPSFAELIYHDPNTLNKHMVVIHPPGRSDSPLPVGALERIVEAASRSNIEISSPYYAVMLRFNSPHLVVRPMVYVQLEDDPQCLVTRSGYDLKFNIDNEMLINHVRSSIR
jgi:hypothetical protein